MAVTKRRSNTQYNDPKSISTGLPGADLDQSMIRTNWAFPEHPTSTYRPTQYMSGKFHRDHGTRRPCRPPPEHPCIYDAIKWECAQSDARNKHKGFCVIFHAKPCANFTETQSNLFECCQGHKIMVVEERKGFCYGPHCPGFEELDGKGRPVPNSPYRFNTWFYYGILPEKLFPEIMEEE
ncbi:b4a0e460-8360-4da2-8416-19521954140b [Sclerotinia trifoliorum]|uniref:B4a0e460-8360-4da2-8416-19521954140b n=1 Tax=Sclerotinia trifoliorum TaxID=28548 RepID=A0A8H2VR82_9HELO|nr:b4a0e460-8360-4da2-8416-19521954140b [Sclerotinia trifoliorum]